MLNKRIAVSVSEVIAQSGPKMSAKLKDFEILDLIGIGAYSKTYLCWYKEYNCYYALKVLQKWVIYNNKQIQHTYNEKEVLSFSNHPGIIKFFTCFNTENAVYLLLEFVPGGNLFTHIRASRRLESSTAKFYAAEIILTLEYLHLHNIVVRDIKPETIFIDCNGHVKLGEFGFSKMLNSRTWTLCGTPDYIAPEIMSGQGYTTTVDWWSLGILIFEMIAGYPPFTSNLSDLFQTSREPEKILIPEHFETECIDLIRKLLVVNPSDRLGVCNRGVYDLKNHPWFHKSPRIDWEILSQWKGTGPFVPSLNHSPLENYHFVEDTTPISELQPQPIPPQIQSLFDDFTLFNSTS